MGRTDYVRIEVTLFAAQGFARAGFTRGKTITVIQGSLPEAPEICGATGCTLIFRNRFWVIL
jgi:hypothetical protein